MKMKCRHDIKIGILFKLFEPMTKETIVRKSRLEPKEMNRFLQDFKKRNLIQELDKKDGTVLYRTTPKGRKIVKYFKDIMKHLEGKKVLAHIYRQRKIGHDEKKKGK